MERYSIFGSNTDTEYLLKLQNNESNIKIDIHNRDHNFTIDYVSSNEIITEYNSLVSQIQKSESEIKEMRNNLNALAGALQQTDLFVKQIEDAGEPMPEDKKMALDMATS